MKFYYVDSDYIQHLKQTDPKNVQNNYENAANKKPYVGIVLRVTIGSLRFVVSMP